MARNFTAEAFSRFLRRACPGERALRRAQAAVARLSALLPAVPGTEAPVAILAGPVAHGTALAPLDQVDVLHPMPASMAGRNPRHALDRLGAALAAARPDLAPRLVDGGLLVDERPVAVRIVPLCHAGGGRFLLPSRRDDGWAPGEPLGTALRLATLDTVSEGRARDLLRLAECWRRRSGAPLAPDLLESLALDFLAERGWRYTGAHAYGRMLADLLSRLCEAHGGQHRIADREEVLTLGTAWAFHARRGAREAGLAVAEAAAGRRTEAAGLWRGLLGAAFPAPTPLWRARAALQAAPLPLLGRGRGRDRGQRLGTALDPRPARPAEAPVLTMIRGGRKG